MLHLMLYTMVYTTCRETGPLVASWYIPWYIAVCMVYTLVYTIFECYIPWYKWFWPLLASWYIPIFWIYGTVCIDFSGISHCTRWYVLGWRWDIPMDIAKVVYTVWGMYHTKYDIYDVSKVWARQPMRYLSTAPLDGGAHCPAAPEPPSSLSVGLVWTVIMLMERPDWLHFGLQA